MSAATVRLAEAFDRVRAAIREAKAAGRIPNRRLVRRDVLRLIPPALMTDLGDAVAAAGLEVLGLDECREACAAALYFALLLEGVR